MNTNPAWLFLAALLFASPAAGDAGDYEAEIMAWRAERLAALRADDGYLNLAGLFWLDEGVYTFGGASGNDIVFPRAGRDRIGRLDVDADGVTMYVVDDAGVRVYGQPVTALKFDIDSADTPVPVTTGSLSWYVIERQGRLGLRLHDSENPALDALPPIPYYEIDRGYRVTGRLKRYREPRTVSVGTVIDGLPYRPASPGVVEFELDGVSMELEAYQVDDRLFFVFGDRTNGRETYGAGRFLYAAAPGIDGLTVLDFNKAYNPPCAFNDFSTCPVASPRNRLPVRIAAGERYADELYVGSTAYRDEPAPGRSTASGTK